MRRLWIAVLAGSLLTALVFAIWPDLDPAFSALFYDPVRGVFPVAADPLASAIRWATWTGMNLSAGVLLALWLLARWRGSPDLARGLFFGWGLMVLGPGLLVNALLKAHVPRPRPADTTFFGGTNPFSGVFEPATGCAANCSFPSGEASGAMALALILAVLLRGTVPPRARPWGVAALATGVCVIGGLRIATGRHFLSDVLLGGWMMLLVALALASALNLRRALPGITPAAWRSLAGR